MNMLTSKELSCVYNPEYFESGSGCIHIVETGNKMSGLAEAEIINCGDFTAISPNWFGKSSGQFRVEYKSVRFRKDCDCTALIEKNGKKYLFLIELKSGRRKIFDDAIFKYPGCYYRTKLYLDAFASYNGADYEEVALIVYAPDAPKGEDSARSKNDAYLDAKSAMINSPKDQLKTKYTQLLHDKALSTLDGADFGTDKLPLKPEYVMKQLKTLVWPVSYPCGKIDFEEVIKLL